MELIHIGPHVTSTWYNKPTDRSLILNYHLFGITRYKRSVVSGFVYWIFRACSTWTHWHESINKAKAVLVQNEYPQLFYETIIKQTLDEIMENKMSDNVPTVSKQIEQQPRSDW